MGTQLNISKNQYLQHLGESVDRIEVLGDSILDKRVPTCGEWRGLQLIEHLREVYERASARIGASENPQIVFEAADPEEALGRLRRSFEILSRRIDQGRPEDPAWNWTGKEMNIAWLARRMAHETAIHATDAALAAGAKETLRPQSLFDPTFASDGIAEFFEIAFARPNVRRKSQTEINTIHLHATDISDCEWTITLTPQSIQAERSHAKADAALRGPASGLYLWTWNRIGIQGMETFGDPAILSRWHEEIAI